MKLISTIFNGFEIEVTLIVQSHTSSPKNGIKVPKDEQLVVRYTSKVGNQSLIFNPTIALVLRGRGQQDPSAWIPAHLLYRFTSMLSHTYHGLSTDKLYYSDQGTMYMDKKLAEAQSRKLSLFRNTLMISPSITYDREGKPMKAILFTADGEAIGVMSHIETMSLIEHLDHFDVNTYSLLAGVVDELETLNNKMDSLIMSNQRIEKLLTARAESVQKQSGLSWRSVSDRLF